MSRARSLAALGLVGAACAPAAVAVASTSHAKLWRNSHHSVTCGVKIHAAGTPAKELLCSAKGIPRGKHAGTVGDPFVQISAKGSPQLVSISQNSFASSTLHTLSPGTTWSLLGVTCHVATTTVKCTNGSAHGFKIGNGSYVHF